MLASLATSLPGPAGASQRVSHAAGNLADVRSTAVTRAGGARDQGNAMRERDPGDATGDTGFESFDAEQQPNAGARDVARPIAAPTRFSPLEPKLLDAGNPAIFPYANPSPGHEFIDLIEAQRAYESGLRLAQAAETSLGAILNGKL